MHAETNVTAPASSTNWDDPAARLALAERIGPNSYNAAMAEHIRRSRVAVVNGYGIRPTQSRFGRLMMVEGTTMAFSTQAEAEAHAGKLAPGPLAVQP